MTFGYFLAFPDLSMFSSADGVCSSLKLKIGWKAREKLLTAAGIRI